MYPYGSKWAHIQTGPSHKAQERFKLPLDPKQRNGTAHNYPTIKCWLRILNCICFCACELVESIAGKNTRCAILPSWIVQIRDHISSHDNGIKEAVWDNKLKEIPKNSGHIMLRVCSDRRCSYTSACLVCLLDTHTFFEAPATPALVAARNIFTVDSTNYNTGSTWITVSSC